MSLKTKIAIFVDYGLFMSFAVKLSESFGRVLYFCQWKSSFPKSCQAMIGENIPGIEKIHNFWNVFEDEDTSPENCVFIFPDIYDGDLQVYLRSIGKRVWGSGRSEDLELKRFETKRFIEKIGLPMNPYKQITGIKALREYLKSAGEKWIKIGCYRGDSETWNFKDYKLAEPKLDELEFRLGPLKSTMKFIVEDPIPDAVEWGFDGFSVDGNFGSYGIQGVERKDESYVGIVRKYDSISKPIRLVNDRLSKSFKEHEYRGFFSTEVRIQKDGKPYLIDPTARAGSPPSEVYQEMYSNWAEIIWAGADGEVANPQPTCSYGVEALIHCDSGGRPWHPIFFPKDIAHCVKLRNATRFGTEWYVTNPDQGTIQVGAVVAIDKTLLGAIRKLKSYADKVEGFGIDVKVESLCKAVDVVRESEAMGFDVSDDPIPSEEEVYAALGK